MCVCVCVEKCPNCLCWFHLRNEKGNGSPFCEIVFATTDVQFSGVPALLSGSVNDGFPNVNPQKDSNSFSARVLQELGVRT